MYMPAQIQLKTVKMVESDVPRGGSMSTSSALLPSLLGVSTAVGEAVAEAEAWASRPTIAATSSRKGYLPHTRDGKLFSLHVQKVQQQIAPSMRAFAKCAGSGRHAPC